MSDQTHHEFFANWLEKLEGQFGGRWRSSSKEISGKFWEDGNRFTVTLHTHREADDFVVTMAGGEVQLNRNGCGTCDAHLNTGLKAAPNRREVPDRPDEAVKAVFAAIKEEAAGLMRAAASVEGMGVGE